MKNESPTYNQATSSYLTDGDDVVIIPFTRSEMVYFNDGYTLAEKVINIPTHADIDTINSRMNEIEQTITRFRFDIGSTDNYYRLKEINNQASELINQLIEIRSQINRFNEVDATVTGLDGRIKLLDGKVAGLQESVNTLTNNFNANMTRLNEEIRYIKEQLVVPPLPSPVTVQQIEDFSSLLAMADMYEEMCAAVPTMSSGDVKQSIVDAYRKLYKAELKSLEEMPDHIKDYIIAELITL